MTTVNERCDRRVPSRSETVVRDLLDRWNREKPDAPFAVFWRGETLTYADMHLRARKVAAGLAALGVRQGDTVVVWLPNGTTCLESWFGINWLGCVYVPLNTAYKGKVLEHVLDNAGASVMIVHADLVSRLNMVDRGHLDKIIVIGETDEKVEGVTMLSSSALYGDPDSVPALERPVEPWDTQSIIYTSGTTGPSKGVMSSYAHLYAMSGEESFRMVGVDDRYMCNLPLFHVGGTIPVMGMLTRGGSVSIIDSFSTSEFWPAIRETETTVVLLLGAMATFVQKMPVGPDDRNHPLRTVIIVPLAEDAPAFAERFGVTVYTLYNMSEISTPLVSEANPAKTGICGKPREGVTLRLVDSNDCEVAPGEVGELIVRTDAPWALNSGYFKNPVATAEAWRNGWFHTGDAFVINEDGDYVFFDRMKDAIRRRGENVSSFEVEAEVTGHPAVNEVAVVAVPSEHTEDEILCIVAPVPGKTIDPAELVAYLQPRMAHFMIPRYIRVIDALPRTPTAKIRKNILRDDGITEDTWDREAAGIVIKREKIG